MRDSLLRALVLLGVATALLTELLSPFHLLRRGPLAVSWLLFVAAFWFSSASQRLRVKKLPLFPAAVSAAILVIAGVVGLTAILSPPNSADAMAYHLPRVVYWAQSGSVAFFPTPYFNQITLGSLAEYFMLHTYVLSGGDHLVNLIAFGAFLGTIAAVSAIAAALGLGARGQALAALFAATIPSAILQASGAKNDSLLTLWLAAAVYFALRRDWAFLGLSAGLAIATKATAYLFAPPMIGVALLLSPRPLPWLRIAGYLAAGVLLLNLPQFARNVQLSGSPLGFETAHGDALFRWRNEHPGWKPTVSNALRHLSEQLGDRSPRWNQMVFDTVVRMHRAMGIDPQDPDTTWSAAAYEPPRNAKNHEANAASRWHLLLLAIAALITVRQRTWVLYTAGLLAGFLLFCFYLKWQPFMTRLELPLFVLGAPLAARLLDRLRPAVLPAILAVFLVNNARPALFDNWTRPLKGPNSLLTTSRDDRYFGDMAQWNNRASYLEAVDRTAQSGCTLVGIDISRNELEYPFQVLLRRRNPAVRFLHTGVTNASARYYPNPVPTPCAVFCPDCAQRAEIVARYASVGPPVQMGHFLLFLKPPAEGLR